MSNVKRVQIIGTGTHYQLTDFTARELAQAALDKAKEAEAILEPAEPALLSSRSRKMVAAVAYSEPLPETPQEQESIEETLQNISVNLTLAAEAAKKWKADN